MTRRLAPAALLAALAVPTAALAAPRVEHLTSTDLTRRMVLPKSELGSLATGLQLDEDSGPVSNETAADGAGPRTCRAPSALAGLGRQGGFAFGWEDSDYSSLKAGSGVESVSTAVEWYRDDAAATAALARSLADIKRNVGASIGNFRLREATEFPVQIEGAAEVLAWHGVATIGRYRVNGATIAVRVGQYVGFAEVSRADDGDRDAQATDLARRLTRRMIDVVAGTAVAPAELPPGDAVGRPPRGGRLDALAITPRQIGPKAFATREEFVKTAAIASYEREFSPGCGSALISVEEDLTLAANVAGAKGGFRAIVARLDLVGGFLKQGPGSAIDLFGKTTTSDVAIGPVGDERRAVRLRYDGAAGRGDFIFGAVRVNRVVAFTVIVGRPGKPVARATARQVFSRMAQRIRTGLPKVA